MSGLFLNVFNMSITASYFILAIVLFRLILKKAPKWVNCLLWALVGLRLAIPFSIESDLSLLPTSNTISTNRESSGLPFSVDTGIYTVDTNVNDYLKSHYYEGVTVPENTFTDTMFVLSVIWLTGVAVMLVYSAISFIRLKKQVSVSLLYRDNIYYCDNIETPFILGVIRPKIFIPSGLEEEQIENVIMHENAHLKRKDHWWKPLGFLILAFYWFNPLIWVAYILLCRDIEKACDEKVIKNMNTEEKKGYLEALVDCSVQRKMVLTCPVAFGEVGVKQRVRAVLNYKKPAFWVIIIAIIVTVAVSVGFLTNPKQNYTMTDFFEFANKPRASAKEKEELKVKYPHFFDLDYSDGLTVYVTKFGGDNYRWYLSSNKNPTDPQKVLHFSEFADTEEIGKILYTYDIGGSGIGIIPIQHGLSSFWWENPEEEVDSLREMLGFSAKEVWRDVDAQFYNNAMAPYSSESEFFKDMNQYGAKINHKSGKLGYNLVFTESQYYKLMTDKYNQVASFYNSIEEDDNEHAVIKKVEFDKDFRNLKIYINRELWETLNFNSIPGVAQQAYSYQMFLEDGVGVNVEVINYKTNNVYFTYTLPRDYSTEDAPKTHSVKETEKVTDKGSGEITNKETTEKATEKTTEKVKTPSNLETVELKYIAYENARDGVQLVIKAPEKIGYGQDFKVYATIKNITNKEIEYSLPSGSEDYPKVNISVSGSESNFTNIDTYGRPYTTDMAYKVLKPDEEISVSYIFRPGKAKGSNVQNATWDYFSKGAYMGNGVFSFGGDSKTYTNDKTVSVNFPVNIV